MALTAHHSSLPSQSRLNRNVPCGVCHKLVHVNNNGCLRRHNNEGSACTGSGSSTTAPVPGGMVSDSCEASTTTLSSQTSLSAQPLTAPTAADPTSQQPAASQSPENTILSTNILPSIEQIGTAKVTTLAHVPKALRTKWADALSNSCQRILRDPDNINAWKALLMLPKCTLFCPPKSRNQTWREKENFTRSKLLQWSKETADSLRDCALKSQKKIRKKKKDQSQEEINVKRAKCAIREGQYGKASQALTSIGLADRSTATQSKLAKLHPEASPPALPPLPVPPPIVFSTKTVMKAIRSFPAASAAGPSGLKAAHLKEAISCTSPTSADKTLSSLTELANLFVSGRAPREAYNGLCAVNLFAVKKKTGGIRPIAVGEVFRRLVAKCASVMTRPTATSSLASLQCGVATQGGCKAIVHSANRLLREKPETWTLSIDFENAFNTVSRTKLFQEVRSRFPQLSAIAEACYGQDPPPLFFDGKVFKSCTGVQQGDPLGPLFFASTLQPLIDRIKYEVPELEMNSWYLDDGFLAGDVQSIHKALRIIEEEAPQIDLHLRKEKCRITRPDDAEATNSNIDSDIPTASSRNLTLLGAPVGTNQFQKDHLLTKADSIRKLMDKLLLLQDPQLQLTMLRACYGLPKFYFSIRTTSPENSLAACIEFDYHQRNALSSLLGSPIDDSTWAQASLPISLGGLGLRSAASHAPIAYASSLRLTATLCRLLLPSFPMTAANPEDDQLSKKQLSWSLDVASHKELLEGVTDDRTRARLHSVSLPHSGDYLAGIPSRSLGLALHPSEFRMSTLYRLGIPVFSSPSSCPACGGLSDIYGDHAIGCGGDYGRIGRHDRLRDILFKAATAATLGPRREVSVNGATQSRPADIYLPSWKRGMPAALDITVISSLQGATVKQAAQTPGHSLRIANSRKLRAHKEDCERAGVNFFPLSVEALGGWDGEALSHIFAIGEMMQRRSGPGQQQCAKRHLLQRLSVELQRGNANLLLLRNPSLPPQIDGLE